jgi:hypothetical protein
MKFYTGTEAKGVPKRRAVQYSCFAGLYVSRYGHTVIVTDVRGFFSFSKPCFGIVPQINWGTRQRSCLRHYATSRKVPVRFPMRSLDFLIRGSVVSMTTDYRLGYRRVGVRVPLGSRIFSSTLRPNRLWGPPSLLYNGYRGLFPRE